MAGFRRYVKSAATVLLFVTVAVTLLEMEVFYSHGDGNTGVRLQDREDIMINPATRLPNEGRIKRKNGGKSRCAGVRGQAGLGFILSKA